MKRDIGSRLLARITGESLVTKVTDSVARPSHEDIARLAYALYTAREQRDGDDVTDWLRAESELGQHYG